MPLVRKPFGKPGEMIEESAIPQKKSAPWPLLARVVRRLRSDGETGVGDTLKRLISYVGGEWYKAAMEALGRPCGCADRQRWLNQRYPY